MVPGTSGQAHEQLSNGVDDEFNLPSLPGKCLRAARGQKLALFRKVLPTGQVQCLPERIHIPAS